MKGRLTVLSGSAAHGDYVFGWEGDTLQRAMDSGCNLNNNCPAAGLTAQTPEQYNACTIKQQAPEAVDGCTFSHVSTGDKITLILTNLNRAQGHAHGRDVSAGLSRQSSALTLRHE